MTDLLFQTGTLVRCPGGGPGEDVTGAKANGVAWFALNVGGDPCVNHDPSVYDEIRKRCAAAQMPVGPWKHCHSIDDVDSLIAVGEEWDADFIGVNIEDVVGEKIDLREVGGHCLDFWVNKYEKPVHMPSVAWLQNGAGWQHVDFAYIALELFPEVPGQERYLEQYQACIDHAFAEGAKRVTLLFSTQSPRSVYPNVAHCLYTADNAGSWSAWKDSAPQTIPKPPAPPTPEVPMLTVKQFPFTGPCYGPPSPNQTKNYSTVKGLKRAMIRLGYLNATLGEETDDYGAALKAAMKQYQRSEHLTQDGNYERAEYGTLRYRKLTEGPHKGEFALDALALKYIREDLLTLCYPHPDRAGVYVGQGLHPTLGVPGNWAIDFMAPGGTPVLAVERAVITRFSGHDPSLPPNDSAGIWGWTIYYETTSGYDYFSTHYGQRTCKVGQIVDVGDQIGVVGRWPGDSGRSHTHLGCTSVKGTADAKAHITKVSQAPKLPEL